MPLNSVIAERIRESKMTGESLVKLFEMFAQMPIPIGASASFNLTWHRPGDVIGPDDLCPTLTFTLTNPGTDGIPTEPAVDGAPTAT